MAHPLKNDLEDILRLIDPSVWSALKNKRIFITGGTGFFGVWLLEALVFANKELRINISVDVLTRNASKFQSKAPHLANADMVNFIEGDVKNFTITTDKKYDYVIHAATESSENLNNNNPFEMMDTIVNGTRRVLEFSRINAVKKLLFVSSGAVYGKQPASITHVDEDCTNGPDILWPRNVYAESKRLAELMCSIYSSHYGIEIPIARCFAFVGPHLNLNIHFAIGNFIRDGLAKKEIEIKGDGTPLRSYMYSADIVIWLLTILVRGGSRKAYNVGSDQAISIEELAKKICNCFANKMNYVVRQKADPSKEREQYIPSIEKARKELNLAINFDLDESINRTINWHSKK